MNFLKQKKKLVYLWKLKHFQTWLYYIDELRKMVGKYAKEKNKEAISACFFQQLLHFSRLNIGWQDIEQEWKSEHLF